ncbi:MAG: CsbD family protein [Desulfovibrionaceae bacterium]|nr:CsbD family protein [Desulfovibrionaceae bacterium]
MSGTKKIVSGRVHQIKGSIKNALGSLVKDRRMEQEGTDEKLYGKVQVKLGHLENTLTE